VSDFGCVTPRRACEALAAGVALFRDGGGVPGLADELVVRSAHDDLLGLGFEVAGPREEQGGAAAGVFVLAEGDGDSFETVGIAAFADDLELVRVRVFPCDAFVDVAEARLIGSDSLLARAHRACRPPRLPVAEEQKA